MRVIEQYLIENTLSIPENWDVYEVGKATAKTKKTSDKYDWVFYVGGNDWEPNFLYQAVFAKESYDRQGEQSRIWIKVKYPATLQPDKEGNGDTPEFQKEQSEFGEMVAKLWIKMAKRLRAEHVKQDNEWHKTMDAENAKQDRIEKQGGKYERKIPPIIKYKGNWADAFALALKQPELNKHIKEMGIDKVEWAEGKKSMEEYGLNG